MHCSRVDYIYFVNLSLLGHSNWESVCFESICVLKNGLNEHKYPLNFWEPLFGTLNLLAEKLLNKHFSLSFYWEFSIFKSSFQSHRVGIPLLDYVDGHIGHGFDDGARSVPGGSHYRHHWILTLWLAFRMLNRSNSSPARFVIQYDRSFERGPTIISSFSSLQIPLVIFILGSPPGWAVVFSMVEKLGAGPFVFRFRFFFWQFPRKNLFRRFGKNRKNIFSKTQKKFWKKNSSWVKIRLFWT